MEPCRKIFEPLTCGSLSFNFILQVPNIAKKIEAFKKDVEAKKKPPE